MKIKKLLLLSLLSINFSTSCLDPLVSKVIQKSRPDLLKKWIEHNGLSQEDRKLCIKIAKEICRQRRLKADVSCLTSKSGRKTPTAGVFWLIGSGILAYIGGSALSNKDNKLDTPTSLIIATITLFFAYKMFVKSCKLDQEELKKTRSNKEKYLDSIEIKHILES